MTRRIVFASGKGGTGKTTTTALMATFAGAEVPVVLADCDVEAANLPIALGATDIRREPFAGLPTAVIDPERCNACGVCERVCRFEAVHVAPFRRSVTIDPFACEGCGRCAGACPNDAITMVPGQAGEVVTARSAIGPLVYGRLRPGEDLSGKLVAEVRSMADRLAEGGEVDLMLIDGPPGTGCPAIASITNTDLLVAVTEPTLSGEHDLARLTALARQLDVPVAIILNKADLSASGAEHIRVRAREEGLELIAEVPFDPELAALALRAGISEVVGGAAAADVPAPADTPAADVAPSGCRMPPPLPDSPGIRALRGAWDVIRP